MTDKGGQAAGGWVDEEEVSSLICSVKARHKHLNTMTAAAHAPLCAALTHHVL